MHNLCRLGSYPECHPGWRCCDGNISWIYDHTIWFTYCWLPLWDHLHFWLPSINCKSCKSVICSAKCFYFFIGPLKFLVLQTAISGENPEDPGHLWHPQFTCYSRFPWRSCRSHYSCHCHWVCLFKGRVGMLKRHLSRLQNLLSKLTYWAI